MSWWLWQKKWKPTRLVTKLCRLPYCPIPVHDYPQIREHGITSLYNIIYHIVIGFIIMVGHRTNMINWRSIWTSGNSGKPHLTFRRQVQTFLYYQIVIPWIWIPIPELIQSSKQREVITPKHYNSRMLLNHKKPIKYQFSR